MPVLSRSALTSSTLADLHALASALSIDGYRRLGRPELVDAIIERQGGADDAEPDVQTEGEAKAEPKPRTRSRAKPRARAKPQARVEPEAAEESAAPVIVEGVIELLANGSGFVRVAPPDPSDDDVYISAAQIRRCELVSGDRVSGPVRAARRSERHPSLARVDEINGEPAAEAVRRTGIEDREVEFPSARLPLGDDDPTLAAIGRVAPFGRGSRVVIAGGARSGKSVAFTSIAAVLAGLGLEFEVVLVGIRPEEMGEWKERPGASISGLSFAASADAQAAAVERAVERARRVAAGGGDAVLMIDTLDGLHPPVARRVLASARKLRDGGSVTIIATAERPFGGETTVVVLNRELLAGGATDAVDPQASGTIRAELLS